MEASHIAVAFRTSMRGKRCAAQEEPNLARLGRSVAACQILRSSSAPAPQAAARPAGSGPRARKGRGRGGPGPAICLVT